jgi:hypothetical protein
MRRFLSLAAVLTAFLMRAIPAGAQVWTGAGSSDNWSDRGNWEGGILPQPGQAVFFGPSARSRSVQDLETPLALAGFLFESVKPGGLFIDGSPIRLSAVGSVIYDNSLTTFGAPVVATPVTLLGATQWTGDASGGYHDPGVVLLDVGGAGSIVFDVPGRGLIGHATYTGTTTIKRGTFQIGGNYGSFTFVPGLTENQGDYLVRPDPGNVAVLSGNGTIGLAPGGKVVVERGGYIRPDQMTIGEPASTRITVLGDVRFGDGSTYACSSDFLDVQGVLDLTGVDDVFLLEGFVDRTRDVVVARYQQRLGQFDRIDPTVVFDGLRPVLRYTSGPGEGAGEVILSIVPEPSAVGMAMTATVYWLLRRRREPTPVDRQTC